MRQSAPHNYTNQQKDSHGLHYIPREQQPSMFQILSWPESYDAAKSNDWLKNLNNGNNKGRFTEPKKY